MTAAGVAVLSAGVQALGGTWLTHAEAHEAVSRLVLRDWQESRAALAALGGRRAGGAEARSGQRLVDVLVGSAESTAGLELEAAEVRGLPIVALLQRALSEERYEGCLRMSDLLAEIGAPDFPEYRAAALVELGRVDEARAIELAEEPRTRVRTRLTQAFSTDLSTLLVRDRNGELLGKTIPQDGSFVANEGVAAGIVPAAALVDAESLGPARSLRLTLDLDLSRLAQKALGSYRGSIVVINPQDGSVLAAVSDKRTARDEDSAALTQLREPASIAKLITVTAALRAGVDVENVLSDMVCRGSLGFPQGPLYCSAINGKLRGLDRAMAVSCNVAFAYLGSMVGREAIVDEFRRYGYDIEDANGYFGQVLQPWPTERELGELSIGLEASAITPIHAALQAATVANGGFMHRPRLHRAADTFLGFSERLLPAEDGWQVIEESWQPMLESAMKAVVEPGGTAYRVAPSDFPIALKTGTASEPQTGFHVNYIGFGPLPEARFAFAVRITHQRTSRRVRNAAYAVTKRFLRSLAGWDAVHYVDVPRPAPVASSAS